MKHVAKIRGVVTIGPPGRTRIENAKVVRSEEQPLGFANAPIEWGGSRWAAYNWDFTTFLGDAHARGNLMLHELFHRIQPDLGLITPGGNNAHLDTLDGRIWLRLEWRALARALGQSGEDRKRAVSDAAAFRLARRSRFANAGENERVEEIREGAAQDSCAVLRGSTPALRRLKRSRSWRVYSNA